MEKIDALKYYKIKEFIHPLILKLFGSSTTGKLIVDGSLPKDHNCLIVGNHYCIEDIPTLAQAVKSHFYLLVSDEDKNTIDGIALGLNGVEWVHRTDKESRKQSSYNIVEILKKDKNFVMYPEATWNLSPNALIMQMNYGCIRIALDANVPIVPVVTFFTKDCRYTVVGEEYYPSNNLNVSINELRDRMSTMIYNTMEKLYKNNSNSMCKKVLDENYYCEKRQDIPENYWEDDINLRYDKYKRASDDKKGVREFESQFIFTGKDEKYQYFQTFNSVVKNDKEDIIVNRISSEKDGYNGKTFGEYQDKNHFGYGYNEKVLKLSLNKKYNY